MKSISINRFRENLKAILEQVASDHTPIKVTHSSGDDFIIISADDWKREQETLYILQNNALSQQISNSIRTHAARTGYKPKKEQQDEIITHGSENPAVIMSLEEHNTMRETTYLLSSPANAKNLLKSISELENRQGTIKELREGP